MDAILIVGSVFIFLSYFIGSWPVGRSVGKFFAGIEVQETGSGATGLSNVLRATNDTLLGLVVGLTDGFVKGTCWMLAVQFVFGSLLHITWIVIGCFIAVLLGHIFPALTNFKTGGKGIAILIGGSLNLIFGTPFIFGMAAWIFTFQASKGIRSLCNLVAISVLLLTGTLLNFSLEFLFFTIFALGLIWYAHRENLKRIKKGKESRSSWESIGKGFLKIWKIREPLKNRSRELLELLKANFKLKK